MLQVFFKIGQLVPEKEDFRRVFTMYDVLSILVMCSASC